MPALGTRDLIPCPQVVPLVFKWMGGQRCTGREGYGALTDFCIAGSAGNQSRDPDSRWNPWKDTGNISWAGGGTRFLPTEETFTTEQLVCNLRIEQCACTDTLWWLLECLIYFLGHSEQKNFLWEWMSGWRLGCIWSSQFLRDLLQKRLNLAPFKMWKQAPGRPSGGKPLKLCRCLLLKRLGKNQSCASLFTFISLFLTLGLFLEQKWNRAENAHLNLVLIIGPNALSVAQRQGSGVGESCYKVLTASLLLFCRCKLLIHLCYHQTMSGKQRLCEFLQHP